MMKVSEYLLLVLALFSEGFTNGEEVQRPICDPELRSKYCNAWYGGDLHTGCKYCGIGPQCPSATPSGRGLIHRPDLVREILNRHNLYRDEVRKGHTNLPASNCLPILRYFQEGYIEGMRTSG